MCTILSKSNVRLLVKSLAVFDFDDGRPKGDFRSRGNEADFVFFFSVESRSSDGASDEAAFVTLWRSFDFGFYTIFPVEVLSKLRGSPTRFESVTEH